MMSTLRTCPGCSTSYCKYAYSSNCSYAYSSISYAYYMHSYQVLYSCVSWYCNIVTFESKKIIFLRYMCTHILIPERIDRSVPGVCVHIYIHEASHTYTYNKYIYDTYIHRVHLHVYQYCREDKNKIYMYY